MCERVGHDYVLSVTDQRVEKHTANTSQNVYTLALLACEHISTCGRHCTCCQVEDVLATGADSLAVVKHAQVDQVEFVAEHILLHEIAC